MSSFLRRLLDLYDNKIAARVLWHDVGRGEVAFLPSVGLFHKFAIRVINVDGNFCGLDFGAEPKPILVTLEQLLAHRLFLAGREIAAPVILPHLKTILDVRL